MSDGNPRRNLVYDLYFGIRAGGTTGWLNAPTSAGSPEYIDQTNIIHAPTTLAGTSADSYYFAPFDFPGNLVVALLHAPGASDGFSLLNFHMGGTPYAPDVNGESLTPIPAQMAISETGPGGGAMVYVPLSGVDHADCQHVYANVMAGMDLGSDQTCSGNDVVPGFEKTLGADGWCGGGHRLRRERVRRPHDGPADQRPGVRAGPPTSSSPPPRPSSKAGASRRPRAPRSATTSTPRCGSRARAVLRMGQVTEPTTSTRKNTGMILASLPPGEWHTGWVRDGQYSTVALSRSGHYAEAKASLEFFLNATPVGEYKSYVGNQNYRISVCRYFGSGEEQADYSGQATPNVEIDGWGMVLWAARQYVEASGDTAWLSSSTQLGPTVYQALVQGIAQPLEANMETNGIVKADSGIWEVHDANKKHFAFTTMAAARGFCDLAALAKKMGNAADASHYAALSATVKTAFLASFVDSQGALGGTIEGIANNQYYDGSVAEAFTWNILPSFSGATANATLGVLGQLKVASGGFKRNNDGLSSYDDNEWILVDLLISNALRRNGRTAEADSYVSLVSDQAAANFFLLPELYNAVASDGPIGIYTGSIPMVGYGGGAFLITTLDRAGLIEPNDCGDGMGITLPVVTCGNTSSSSSGGSSGGGSTGTGAGTGASVSGGGGGGNALLPPRTARRVPLPGPASSGGPPGGAAPARRRPLARRAAAAASRARAGTLSAGLMDTSSAYARPSALAIRSDSP